MMDNKFETPWSQIDECAATWADNEHFMGYYDAGDPDCPVPTDNRSKRYRHSFIIRRREVAGRPVPANVARRRLEHLDRVEPDRRWNSFKTSHEEGRGNG